MLLNELKAKLSQIHGCGIKENESLHRYTSFKIGGPADLMVEPADLTGLQQVLKVVAAAEVPYFVLGKGSNILVGDRGIRGVVIMMNKLISIRVEGTRLTAGAGVTLARLAAQALEAELSGLEFASGIPGTLGGAVVMNAGAYDGEIKDVITRITAFAPAGEKRVLTNAEADFGYRHSIFQQNGWIVAEVELELLRGEASAVRARMNELNSRRREKQPLEFPSAGSTFKRPAGYYAGALIEGAGLKGYRVGDAQVSEKHAGFVINRGNASAADVLRLIRHVQNEVRTRHGVELEPEVHLVGEFAEE